MAPNIPGNIWNIGNPEPQKRPVAQKPVRDGLGDVLNRIDEKREETEERQFAQGMEEGVGVYRRLRSNEPAGISLSLEVGAKNIRIETPADISTALITAQASKRDISCDPRTKGVLTRMSTEALEYAKERSDIAAFVYAFQTAKISQSLDSSLHAAYFTLLKQFSSAEARAQLRNGLLSLNYGDEAMRADNVYFAAFEDLARKTLETTEGEYDFGKALMRNYLSCEVEPHLIATRITRDKQWFRVQEQREDILLPYASKDIISLATERAKLPTYHLFVNDRTAVGTALILEPKTKGMLSAYGHEQLKTVDSEDTLQIALADLYLGDGLQSEAVVADILKLVEQDKYTAAIQRDLKLYHNS